MTLLQQPLGSGFGASSTASDVMAGLDLSGRCAMVTGAASGLGRETALALASAGARVIAAVRDPVRVREQFAATKTSAMIDLRPIDLLDPTSIKQFAQRFHDERCALDILVNSAAVMALPHREVDSRGIELQFATNHLGHFQLVGHLWPALVRSGSARVVSVASRGHRLSPVDFDDLSFDRRPYDRWIAYGQSKTANILFALELDRRGQADGVRAFSVHPGAIVGTRLARHMSVEEIRAAGAIDEQGRAVIDPGNDRKTVAQGAATQLWCATSPRLKGMGGLYCEDVDVAPMASAAQQTGRTFPGVSAFATDAAAALRLWELSEDLASVSYP